MRELLAQAERWRGRPLAPAQWRFCQGRVEAALARVRGTCPADFARSQGLTVELSHAPHRMGPLRLRARLEGRRILIYRGALQEEGIPLEVALAHELFHWLDPDCRGELGELAAHLFATCWLALPGFAGLFDLEPVNSRQLVVDRSVNYQLLTVDSLGASP